VEVVLYPHPALRHSAEPLRRVDQNIKSIVAEMFDLMYAHAGVGLAANQVGLPIQLFVANPSGKRGEGEEFVFINPVISQPKGRSEAEEGCLSLPALYARVVRPEQIRVRAYDLTGREMDQIVDDYLARIIQHEVDHLQGRLFIDRLPPTTLEQFQPSLEAFELEYRAHQASGRIPPNDEIRERLAEFASQYCAQR
jgi:peptide deformylase